MKKLFLLLAMVFSLGISTVALDAEAAKRLGSGKSMGTQRQATPDKASTSAAAPAAGAAAAAPTRSWMGPIAGIAAGLGLAALASHLGFGGELASMLMMGLLAAGVMVAIGFFMRKRAAAQRAATGQDQSPNINQSPYAAVQPGAGQLGQMAPAYKMSMPTANGSMIGSAIGAGSGASLAAVNALPADFDAAAFASNAKVNFIRLQAANDVGNLDDIRQFTTPEMFAELKMELANRGLAVQKTEVISIQAEVTHVDENAYRYVVSVRFNGVMRDDSGAPDESFDEVWYLTKPRTGNPGWVLSGIEQML